MLSTTVRNNNFIHNYQCVMSSLHRHTLTVRGGRSPVQDFSCCRSTCTWIYSQTGIMTSELSYFNLFLPLESLDSVAYEWSTQKRAELFWCL